MSSHHFSMRINSNISNNDIEYNIINTERKATFLKSFKTANPNVKFHTDNVKMIKYNRNKQLTNFYNQFKETKYTWFEIGFDFRTTTRLADIVLKAKRNLSKIGLDPIAYIWIIDKGKRNGLMHYHLLIVTDKIQLKGKQLPKELQLTFKQRIVHSSFVSNKKWIIAYLKKKPIYYIGRKRRVFGKSREKKQIEKN